jgi:isoleucyl-tRNA synthetase
VIFRNTPQWFIAMDKDIEDDGKVKPGDTLRARALQAISVTQWVPPSGQNRINGMIESRPDWVISRQRAWGVPIAVFVREKGDGSAEILQDETVNQRICRGLHGGRRRRLVSRRRARALPRVTRERGLEEGRRHLRRLVRFRLDARLRAGGPPEFPQLGNIVRKIDGGADTVMYLEGATSIAAGSIPRCWKAAAPAAARPMTSC